ncbi:hypothetical protein RQX21_00680, partial [Streptococcus pneumoniae]|nr:hypothetical protein [Streptococcus pneumoniae]
MTKYKKAVKEACNMIAEDNGIPEYSKYYGDLSAKEIREEVEEYGLKVFNPNHSYLSQLDVTYKTPDLMSHFLPP